ncbi:HD domain-containing phosphohydrolase [Psychrilyobacter atlanticus]|uniref:HD domain-containing phosphohydrolase n=1 Tax=Psychrilyobacter atlanticus TaxID=271091 RepID=UPI0004031670|nr:HD domain-containing phosphohydrolase [Psychrilyobacter atlanticus]
MKKFIWIFLFVFSISAFGKKLITVPLTSEEKEWIKSIKKDKIKIYLDSDLGILNYSVKGKYDGIYLELIKILENSTGMEFEIIKKDENEFEAEINSGTLDIVMGVEDYKRNRGDYYYLEKPITLNGVFLTRKDYPITDSNTDLSGKIVVYLHNDQIVNKVINKYGNRVVVVQKPNFKEAVQSLLSREADIYVDDLEDTLKYLLKNNVPEIKINYSSSSLETDYYIGGLYKYKPLIDIIGRISDTFDLTNKAVYKEVLDYTKDHLEISKEIENYLKKNKTLKVLLPKNINAYPIYYRDSSGKHNGFLLNYFYEIEQIFGIKMLFEESDSMEGFHINPYVAAINGKDINNNNDFLTTDPYLHFQFHIFNREERGYISNLESLKKYKIAARKGSLEETYLLKKGLEKNLVLFDTDRDVIESLDQGAVDVIIGRVRKVHYLLKKYNIQSIKTTGIISDKISLKFGIPKDNEVLYFLINSYTKDFFSSIESRKNNFLERKIKVIKDFKISIIITLISALGFLAVYIHLKKFKALYSKLTNITLGMVEALENANTYNDEDTGDHVKRISRYSEFIAYEMKLSNKFIKEIGLYASLHDIGKIGISDAILKKPGKLTEEEFETMKTHAEIGYNMIKDLEVSEVALNIIRYHHEKWDGNGYGKGLKGTEIPLEARIVALADVYDALRQKRVYKKSFTHEKSVEIISSESGKHFDPYIVRIFLRNHNHFKDIFDNEK